MTKKRPGDPTIPYRRRPSKLGLEMKPVHIYTYLVDDEKDLVDEARRIQRVTMSQFCAEALVERAKKVIAAHRKRQS
jgi:hypothetical protein